MPTQLFNYDYYYYHYYQARNNDARYASLHVELLLLRNAIVFLLILLQDTNLLKHILPKFDED